MSRRREILASPIFRKSGPHAGGRKAARAAFKQALRREVRERGGQRHDD